MTRYERFDQKQRLGPPPWSGPAVEAWEEAHGHDVRLKCYVEFGCRLIERDLDEAEERLAAVASDDPESEAIHRPQVSRRSGITDCIHCDVPWPCWTARAADREWGDDCETCEGYQIIDTGGPCPTCRGAGSAAGEVGS